MESSDTAKSELAGPGEQLLEARERAGVSPREMADRLNWLPAHLIAIEQNRFDDLRSQAFVRGYLRAYARALELNEDAIVGLYNARTPEAAQAERDAIAVRRGEGPGSTNSVLWIVLGCLFAALLVVMVWWKQQPSSPGGDTDAEASAGSAVDISAENAAAQELLESTESDAGDGLLQTVEDDSGAAATLVTDAEVNTANAVTDPSRSAESASLEGVAAVGGEMNDAGSADGDQLAAEQAPFAADNIDNMLRFQFSDECWLEVKDGSGILIYSDLKQAGDTLSLRGDPPFQIVAGNAAAVALTYRGQPVPVTAPPGRNKARVTVGTGIDGTGADGTGSDVEEGES